MTGTDWGELYRISREQGIKDAGLYKLAAYILAVLAVIFLFIFPFASAMFFCMALLSIYWRHRNLTGEFLLFNVRVTGKYRTEKILCSDPGEEDIVNVTGRFKISVSSVSAIKPGGPEKISRSYSEFKEMIVPDEVYSLYKENDVFLFILTPAYDLFAYLSYGGVIFLPRSLPVK